MPEGASIRWLRHVVRVVEHQRGQRVARGDRRSVLGHDQQGVGAGHGREDAGPLRSRQARRQRTVVPLGPERHPQEVLEAGAEGDRLAAALSDKSILLMGGHGVTVVGPTVHDAFDECYAAERTAMYQLTAMSTGRALRALPESERRHWHGVWSEKVDARLHLDAWRRILDREEPDYAT